MIKFSLTVTEKTMFAKNLKILRKQAGFSQERMAQHLQITRATYTKLENGKKSPTLLDVENIASILDVEMESLISKAGVGAHSKIKKKKKLFSKLKKTQTEVNEFNPDKFKKVVAYIITKSGHLDKFGKTVLYKLLYFVDFDYYEKYDKPLTGMTYFNNQFGPTPEVSTFQSILDDMVAANQITIYNGEFQGKKQQRYLINADNRIDVDDLSLREIRHINDVLNRLEDKTATELSDLAHQDTPWLATEPRQPIEYGLSKYRTAATSVSKTQDGL